MLTHGALHRLAIEITIPQKLGLTPKVGLDPSSSATQKVGIYRGLKVGICRAYKAGVSQMSHDVPI